MSAPTPNILGLAAPLTQTSTLHDEVAKAVEDALEHREPSEAQKTREKRKRAALSLGKGVTMLVGVALSAYLGLQQAISERPTKGEVKEDLTRVEAAHAESEDRVDYIEREVMKIGGRVEALDKKVSEGFDEIKEELRYLRRQR